MSSKLLPNHLYKIILLVLSLFLPVTNSYSANTSPEISKLQGNKLSFYFQNIEVRTLLDLIAKTSGTNFIISDAVKGTTTLNLKNVTWEQALNIVLQSRGLDSRRIGNAIYISTTEDIAQNATKQLQATQDIANLSPLSSELLTLKYTDATTTSKFLKGEGGSILSPRGEVAVDNRTNSVIIRDIQPNLRQVVQYLKKLDIPAKQVSIEARIVEIDSSYESQLGVRFGISNTRSLSGTFYGANQLALGTSAAAVGNPNSTNPQPDPTPRLNFNLPANALSTGAQPASAGLALARLGPVLLDLELSALEEERHTRVISRPRVVTSNQQKAIIQSGQEIPYAQATSSGATSIDFKNAVLSLEITPQITPDNKILLKMKATQDTVGDQLLITATTFGPPTINTQSVESYVTLNDNETVVIGGIYRLTKQNTYDRVPFFSDLPIVGGLFKHRGINNQKSELLVFITPKIIKPGEHAIAYSGYKGS
jgi:type IV pilus assembly protein PilQ